MLSQLLWNRIHHQLLHEGLEDPQDKPAANETETAKWCSIWIWLPLIHHRYSIKRSRKKDDTRCEKCPSPHFFLLRHCRNAYETQSTNMYHMIHWSCLHSERDKKWEYWSFDTENEYQNHKYKRHGPQTFQTSFISSDRFVIAWAPMAPSPTPDGRRHMPCNEYMDHQCCRVNHLMKLKIIKYFEYSGHKIYWKKPRKYTFCPFNFLYLLRRRNQLRVTSRCSASSLC